MQDRLKEFLLKNWIFAVLAALALLLVASAVLLNLGNTGVATQDAIYTLLILVAAMVVWTSTHAKQRGAVSTIRMSSVKQFLRRNWGAPFALLLVALVVVSGIYLGEGNSLFASKVAIFASSILGAGILLEIASQARYGSTSLSRSWDAPKRYLRENWGAPFVIAFIALLVTAAVILSAGNSGIANDIAVYAFYSLVLGVALQIASYVKYGSKEA